MGRGKFGKYIYEKNRVEAFSDGVFAIIITLLVLDIKVPDFEKNQKMGDAISLLWEQRSEIFSWALSFLMVGVGWMQHHNIIHMAKRMDLGMIWINLFTLMGFCLVPFTMKMMAVYPLDPAVITLFGMDLALTTLTMCWMFRYIWKYELKSTYDYKVTGRHVTFTFIAAPVLYTVASLSAWLSPYLSYSIFILLPVCFIFPLDKEVTSDNQ